MQHVSNVNPNAPKPAPAATDSAVADKFGSRLTLLDKTLAYYVSPRGMNCFWGRVLNGCYIVVSWNLGTAGVALFDFRKYKFLYDPMYFDGLTNENRRCTLVHEAVHIACLHLPRTARLVALAPDEETRRAIYAVQNLAADMETNDSYVRLEHDFQTTIDQGEYWILPEYFDLPRGLSMEKYIELLLRDLPKTVKDLNKLAEGMRNGNAPPQQAGGSRAGKNGQSAKWEASAEESNKASMPEMVEAGKSHKDLVDQLLGDHKFLTGGSHEEWVKALEELAQQPGKLEQISEELSKEARNIVRVAAEATSHLRGTMPGNMAQQVAMLMEEPTVPWTDLMREWVLGNVGRRFVDTNRIPSISLLATDHVEPYPGVVLEPEVNVTWITDTSGSMSDKSYQDAMSEMCGLMNQTKAIRLHHIQVDTHIQHEAIYDNGDFDAEKVSGRYGYGGTRLEAAFARALNIDLGAWAGDVEKVDEVRAPDMLIVYTDGYIEDMAPVIEKYHNGCPTLWLITPSGCVPPAVNDLGAPHFAIRATR
jgi:predicted metal-dependent peptidase